MCLQCCRARKSEKNRSARVSERLIFSAAQSLTSNQPHTRLAPRAKTLARLKAAFTPLPFGRDWYRGDLVPRHTRVSDTCSVRCGLMLSTCPRKISAFLHTGNSRGTTRDFHRPASDAAPNRTSVSPRIPLVRPHSRAALSKLQSLSILPPPPSPGKSRARWITPRELPDARLSSRRGGGGRG